MCIILHTQNHIFAVATLLPSSYLAERNRRSGVTLLPYWGLLRLLHHPLKVRYRLVWSQGSAFSSREQDSSEAEGMTLVTSMLVRPSAKSSMLTVRRLPVTCRLIRLIRGLRKSLKNRRKMQKISNYFFRSVITVCRKFHCEKHGSTYSWRVLRKTREVYSSNNDVLDRLRAT